jgi:hypothetical protein
MSLALLSRQVLAGLILSIACGTAFATPLIQSTRQETHVNTIPFQIVDWGSASGFSEPTNLVINNLTSWTQMWNKAANCGKYPELGPCVTPSPPINLTTYTMLAAFGGFYPWPHRLNFTYIESRDSILYAHHHISQVGPGCLVAATVYYPFQWVAIPKTKANVIFVEDPAGTFPCHNS